MVRTFVLLLGLWGAVAAQEPRTWLGVGLTEVTAEASESLGLSETAGAMIAHVVDGSPADRAGLQKGEVILRYNDQPVSGVYEMGRLVRETVAGQLIPVVLASTQGKRTVEVRIEQLHPSTPPRPPEPPQITSVGPLDFDIPRPVMVVRNRSLGATLEPLQGQLAEFFGSTAGVLVREVREGSAAAEAGLQAGDLIVEANQQEIRHPDQLRRALNQRTRDAVELRVLRDRKSRVLNVRVESGNPCGRPFTQRFGQR